MKLKLIFLWIFICYCQFGNAQHKFQDGFDLLEEQSYTQAIVYFNKVLETDSLNLTARICYGRALGLGGQKAEALSLFQILSQEYKEELEVKLNLAEAYMWNEKYEAAKSIYQELLTSNPNNFVANFGFANANASLFENDIALEYINKAIELDPANANAILSKKYILISKAYKNYKKGNYVAAQNDINSILLAYPNSPEAQDIQQQIRAHTNTSLGIAYGNSQDHAGNSAETKLFSTTLNLNERHRTSLYFNVRNTSRLSDQSSGEQRVLMLSDKINLGEKADFELAIGSSSELYANKIVGKNIIGRSRLELYLVPQLYWSLSYGKTIQNYNSDLLLQQIQLQEFATSFNLTALNSIGWFANLSYTKQSDNNNRILLNNSLYFKLTDSPVWKFGINTTYLKYNTDRSEFYFSPQDFKSAELFVALNNEKQNSPFKYSITAAVGGQQIKGKDQQGVARIECRAAYNFGHGMAIVGDYLYSNAAQTIAIGAFSYSEWKIGLNYSLERHFQKSKF